MLDTARELRDFPKRLADLINHAASGNVDEFSRRSGVGKNTLRAWLDTERPSYPSLPNLLRLAQTLGMSLEELVHGPREERPAAVLTPKDQLEILIQSLKTASGLGQLPRAVRIRYKERIQYLESLMRRLVFDSEEFLAELKAAAENKRFDPDVLRRSWKRTEGNNKENRA